MALRGPANGRRVLAALLVLVCCAAFLGLRPAHASTTAYIDQTVFASSVPKLMTLGGGYRVQVDVTNNGTSSLQGAVELVYPQQYFFSDQPFQVLLLPPGESVVLTFNLVPSDIHVGPMTVSALLVANATGYFAITDRVDTTVLSIQKSPLFANLPVVAAIVVVLGGGLYVLARVLRKPRTPSQSAGPLHVRAKSYTKHEFALHPRRPFHHRA